ncbi:unnamed protein product, partial [Heterotrigona itama]
NLNDDKPLSREASESSHVLILDSLPDILTGRLIGCAVRCTDRSGSVYEKLSWLIGADQ